MGSTKLGPGSFLHTVITGIVGEVASKGEFGSKDQENHGKSCFSSQRLNTL